MFTIPVDDLYVSYFHICAKFSAKRVDGDAGDWKGMIR